LPIKGLVNTSRKLRKHEIKILRNLISFFSETADMSFMLVQRFLDVDQMLTYKPFCTITKLENAF